MSFSLTLNRDPESSMSVYGQKDGLFAVKIPMFWLPACVLLRVTWLPWGRIPKTPGIQYKFHKWVLVRICNVWLSRIFSDSTTDLYCKNLQPHGEALRFYVCKLSEERKSEISGDPSSSTCPLVAALRPQDRGLPQQGLRLRGSVPTREPSCYPRKTSDLQHASLPKSLERFVTTVLSSFLQEWKIKWAFYS